MRVKAGPTQSMIRCFARKEWISCNCNSISASQGPFNKMYGLRSQKSMLSKGGKNMIIKVFDKPNHLISGEAKLWIKISVKNFLQGTRWIFTLIHQTHASHQCMQHVIRCGMIRHVPGKRLEISRHERIQVGIQQSIVKVEQQC